MKYLFLIFILSNSYLLFSQKDSIKKMYELEFGVGINVYPFNSVPNFWSKLDPSFVYPESVDTNYSTFSNKNLNGQSIVFLQFSYKLLNSSKKYSPKFSFSYQYGEGYYNSQSWYKSDKFTIDTLISQKTGEKFAVDSTVESSVHKYYMSNLHQIGANFLLEQNSTKRLSCHFGAGILLGISSNNHVENYQRIYSNGAQQVHSGHSISDIYYEQYNQKSKNYTTFTLNFPIGISFILSKKNNFFSKLALTYEFGIGNTWYFIPEYGTVQSFNFRHTSGLKYRF